MKISIQELLVVFIVALVVVGPDKLPMYAKKLGTALAQFRKFSEDATKDIRESIVEPLEEAQRPLREAMEPVAELERSVKSNVKEIQQSFADIGKPKKSSDSSDGEKVSSQSEGKKEHVSGESAESEAGGKQEIASEESAESGTDGKQEISSEEPVLSGTEEEREISSGSQEVSSEGPEKLSGGSRERQDNAEEAVS